MVAIGVYTAQMWSPQQAREYLAGLDAAFVRPRRKAAARSTRR